MYVHISNKILTTCKKFNDCKYMCIKNLMTVNIYMCAYMCTYIKI